MWNAIQYVTTGLSLVAFVVAAITFVYRSRLQRRVEIIKSAPEKDRLEAIATTAEFFRVNVAGLSRAQQEKIVLAQIHARAQRDMLTAGVLLILAIIMGGIAIVSIFGKPRPDQDVSPSMRDKLVGEYQVSLGPNGGCNGGKPNTYPNNPGKITTDGSTLTAYNECNEPSSIRISADGQRIFWYGESAKLDFSSAELRIKDDAGNTWEKIPK